MNLRAGRNQRGVAFRTAAEFFRLPALILRAAAQDISDNILRLDGDADRRR